MLKIIKERTPETITTHRIEFFYSEDRNVGFCFPANPDGTIALDQMIDEAKVNYEYCLTNTDLIGPEFNTYTNTYINPAVGRCTCGADIVLENKYLGATDCKCGRWYNLFGQELTDPKYWEVNYEY